MYTHGGTFDVVRFVERRKKEEGGVGMTGILFYLRVRVNPSHFDSILAKRQFTTWAVRASSVLDGFAVMATTLVPFH